MTLNTNRSVEEYEDLLGEIAGECGQLSVLINQLLLLAETDTARFVLESHSVALDALVERSVDMFRGAAEERGIQLIAECTPGAKVSGDADRLRQVVNNLIDNSLKFTPRGGAILIRTRSVGAPLAAVRSGAAVDLHPRADPSGRPPNVIAITELPIDAPARRVP